MKRFVFLTTVIAVCLAEPQRKLEIEPAEVVEPNPEHAGKCFQKLTNKAYEVGASWKDPKKCVQYTCEKGNDGKVSILLAGCVNVEGKAPCTADGGSPKAPYPECCPSPKCSLKENKGKP